MVVVAYKTMNLTAEWSQIRRVKCGHCRTPFVYVASETVALSVAGLPVLSSDDAMREQIANSVRRRLRKVALDRRIGAARCPGCGRFQGWMIQALVGRATPFVLGMMVPVCGLAYAVSSDHGNSAAVFAAVALAGAALFAGIAALWVRHKLGAGTRPDPRSLSDSAARRFLAECGKKRVDAALAWRYDVVLRRSPSEQVAVVSLGMDDLVGGFQVPQSLAEARDGALER